jgi:hypothetical protein
MNEMERQKQRDQDDFDAQADDRRKPAGQDIRSGQQQQGEGGQKPRPGEGQNQRRDESQGQRPKQEFPGKQDGRDAQPNQPAQEKPKGGRQDR